MHMVGPVTDHHPRVLRKAHLLSKTLTGLSPLSITEQPILGGEAPLVYARSLQQSTTKRLISYTKPCSHSGSSWAACGEVKALLTSQGQLVRPPRYLLGAPLRSAGFWEAKDSPASIVALERRIATSARFWAALQSIGVVSVGFFRGLRRLICRVVMALSSRLGIVAR